MTSSPFPGCLLVRLPLILRGDQYQSKAVRDLIVAKDTYKEEGIIGSDDKDIWDAPKAKLIGAEIDSSPPVRRLGLATVAAPARKRLSLAFISLELAKVPQTSDALWACLIGGWTSCLMYRRPFMSLFSEVYSIVNMEEVSQDRPKLCPMSRGAAQEIQLAAILCPLFVTDLSAMLQTERVRWCLGLWTFSWFELCGRLAERKLATPECSRGLKPSSGSWTGTERRIPLVASGLQLSLTGREPFVSTSLRFVEERARFLIASQLEDGSLVLFWI